MRGLESGGGGSRRQICAIYTLKWRKKNLRIADGIRRRPRICVAINGPVGLEIAEGSGRRGEEVGIESRAVLY